MYVRVRVRMWAACRPRVATEGGVRVGVTPMNQDIPVMKVATVHMMDVIMLAVVWDNTDGI